MSDKVIRYARIPLSFDLSTAQEEVRTLPAQWKAHQNTGHYEGGWTVLSLRAPGGNPEHIAGEAMGKGSYENTPLLDQAPILRKLLESLPCPVQATRLLRLAPGSLIKEHRDVELCFERGEARLHIPLFTNPLVDFYVDGERMLMEEGSCWYINANLPHRVSNSGSSERIHLVIDCIVSEGLKELFEKSTRRYTTTNVREIMDARIIRELRLMNLRNWIPSELIKSETEWLCRWLYTADLPFTDPFFDETLLKCKYLPVNKSRFRPTGSIPSLVEWATDLPSVPPTAFIFHLSRCGSTLVSQLLGMGPDNIVLSEAPFIDTLLRLPLESDDSIDKEAAIKAALRFYGRQRTGHEQRLFIKTDSWHMFFYQQLRRWYPDIPFILLYRSPEEILFSQQKKRGMHAIPGVIEAALLGIKENLDYPGDLDGHLIKVLESYLTRFLEIAATDNRAFLMNYSEGIPAIVEKIAGLTDMAITDPLREQMRLRTQYHGKYPGQLFTKQTPEIPPLRLAQAMALYEQLDRLRATHRMAPLADTRR